MITFTVPCVKRQFTSRQAYGDTPEKHGLLGARETASVAETATIFMEASLHKKHSEIDNLDFYHQGL